MFYRDWTNLWMNKLDVYIFIEWIFMRIVLWISRNWNFIHDDIFKDEIITI